MFHALRAELKAIQDWDNRNFRMATWTERAAIAIRADRKKELTRKLQEIAARN